MSADAGDLLFYVPDGRSPTDGLIARLTGGPYAHVAVALGDGSVIAAIGRGVSHYPQGKPSMMLPTGAHCGNLDPQLTWLKMQVGKPYSYADIVDAAAALVWANLQPTISWGPFSIRVPQPEVSAILQRGAFDCSSLAARFLIGARYAALPPAIAANPDVCSPNSLARALA